MLLVLYGYFGLQRACFYKFIPQFLDSKRLIMAERIIIFINA